MPQKDKPTVPEAPASVETPAPPAGDADVHAGRSYSVGTTVKKGKRKVRYVETNDPKKGCRFL